MSEKLSSLSIYMYIFFKKTVIISAISAVLSGSKKGVDFPSLGQSVKE